MNKNEQIRIIENFIKIKNSWMDDVFFFVTFTSYAMITCRAWDLPRDFEINLCLN